jgi:hypothetical protein
MTSTASPETNLRYTRKISQIERLRILGAVLAGDSKKAVAAAHNLPPIRVHFIVHSAGF